MRLLSYENAGAPNNPYRGCFVICGDWLNNSTPGFLGAVFLVSWHEALLLQRLLEI